MGIRSGLLESALLGGQPGASTAYVGPGDVVSTALAWWGFRAYSLATVGANAVRLVRASDSTEQDFVTLANGNLDIASITTFLAATTGKIVTLYDQTGNSRDITQGTDASRPAYTASIVGSLSGARFTGATKLAKAVWVTQAQPLTISAALKPIGGGTASQFIGTVTGDRGLYFYSDKVDEYWGGTPISPTVTHGSFYTIQAVGNGASSVVAVNGSDTTVSPGTSGFASQDFTIGRNGGTETMDFLECGVWGSGFSGGNRTSMDSNQRAYWGF